MALIKCYECSREISDKAPACPHCGAPKEALPPEIEEAEILESVVVVDEPEPITPETVSAPSTEPESVATKDEGFNKVVAIAVGALVFQIARSLGMNFGFLTVISLAIPYALLVRYGKKQSRQVYAGIIAALVVTLGIAISAGNEASVSDTDAWVTADRLDRRTCPQPSCGSVGVQFRGDGVTIYERSNGWARITGPYNASCFNGVSEYVDSGNDACEEANGIVDGRFAEWVSAQYLSSERPPDPAAGATGDYALVSGSDDYATYKDAFAKAASGLIANGSCSRADFEEMGGWWKSSLRGAGEPVYFTYCGGFTIADRLYLNASTGEVFR